MGNKNKWTFQTLRDRPELAGEFYTQKERIWPEFMRNDVHSVKLWGPYVSGVYDAFQMYLRNEEGAPIAVGQSIPLVWDGTLSGLPVGWNDCLVRGAADYEDGRAPNTLAALEISVQPEYRGRGISYRMIKALRELAGEHGFQALIAAVRPSLKMQYPLAPMERYVRWKREDGAPFDPWLRVHWRSGAEILSVAYPSMLVEGSVDTWENWIGIPFPESGDYVIPDALVPIQIDREMDYGRYIERNVWVHHPITSQRLLKE